jgi:hypothetical protein
MERRAFAALFAAGSLALASVAGAQAPMMPGTPSTEATTGHADVPPSQKEMMGTVQSIDDDKLVLDNGTQFLLPPAADLDRAEIEEGAQVLVSYHDEGGEKVVTSIKLGS